MERFNPADRDFLDPVSDYARWIAGSAMRHWQAMKSAPAEVILSAYPKTLRNNVDMTTGMPRPRRA
ncbi:hypothetical protein [Marinilabilia sp.]